MRRVDPGVHHIHVNADAVVGRGVAATQRQGRLIDAVESPRVGRDMLLRIREDVHHSGMTPKVTLRDTADSEAAEQGSVLVVDGKAIAGTIEHMGLDIVVAGAVIDLDNEPRPTGEGHIA